VSGYADALTLETPRLLLRPPRIEDFEAYAAFASDPVAQEFLGGVRPRTAAWRSFMTIAGAWQLQGFALFMVLLKASNEWIGCVGPWRPDGWPGTEVGWSIARSHWNHGYATEAATAAIRWAFSQLAWTDVIHVIDVGNVASQAVARKLGSRNRGPGRLPAPHDDAVVEIWGQTRAEWQARSAAN
jgi:RimJ/RimL family protein N-acetyltransferase